MSSNPLSIDSRSGSVIRNRIAELHSDCLKSFPGLIPRVFAEMGFFPTGSSAGSDALGGGRFTIPRFPNTAFPLRLFCDGRPAGFISYDQPNPW